MPTKFEADDTDNNQPQTNQAQAAGRFLENDGTYNGCTHCTNPSPDGISCSYRQGTHRLCQQHNTAHQCTSVMMLGVSLVKFCEYLRPMAQTTSNNPASNNDSQAIIVPVQADAGRPA